MDPPGELRESPPDYDDDMIRHRSDLAYLRSSKAPLVPRSQSARQWSRSNSSTFGFASDEEVPPVSVVDLSALSQLSSYQLTSISRHYRRNQKLLTAFEQQMNDSDPKAMAMAYLIGLIFVESAVLQIPKHGYYYSKRHKEERLQSSIDALRVTHQLEEILMQQQQEFKASQSLNKDAANDKETQRKKQHLIRESCKLERLRNVANEQFECASNDRRNDATPNNIKSHITEYVRSVLDACIAPSLSMTTPGNRVRTDSTVAHADTPARGRTMSITESLKAFGSNFSDGLCPSGTRVPVVSEMGATKANTEQVPTPTRPLARPPPATTPLVKHTVIASGVPWSPSIEATLDTDQYVSVSVSEDEQKKEEFRRDSILEQRTLPDRQESFTEYQVLQQAMYDSGSELLYATSVETFENHNQELEHRYSDPDELPASGSNVSSTANGVSIELLTQCYHDDFDAMCESGRINAFQSKTYQGRMKGSTNGCTIIAPLMCIHHFHDDGTIPDEGISLETIEDVIDKETPSILPGIREKLGVAPNGFLIPSDAHESLMEQQYLGSEQFVTVCGGNILDDTHLEALVIALREAKPKKLAATLFFHEHVISILQLRREEPVETTEGENGDGGPGSPSKKHYPRVWFDVIDSLPHTKTYERFLKNESGLSSRTATTVVTNASEGSSKANSPLSPRRKKKIKKPIASLMGRMRSGGKAPKSSSAAQLLQSYDDEEDPAEFIPESRPAEPYMNSQDSIDGDDDLPQPNAMRMRCMDEASLIAALRWYACSVFSDTNCSYINKYPWDENNADADPRIFQAFVWSEA